MGLLLYGAAWGLFLEPEALLGLGPADAGEVKCADEVAARLGASARLGAELLQP